MKSLRPKGEADPLNVQDIVMRATQEFGFVQCDSDRGVRYAAHRLLKCGTSPSHDEKDREMALMMDAVEMILGDDRRNDKHFLKCFVISNGPIEVVYLYDTHEMETRVLLERLGRVLDYSITIE